jgi:pimeloyl-ACP methyl ester carboxylesterase
MTPQRARPSTNLLYYLPGRGGRLATGLGEGLRSRGWDVTGRETLGAFRDMHFADQVHTVAQDLQQHFWHAQARVVAVSFGAYLFLHAQAQLPSYPGWVLLLSPIVGGFADAASGTHFVPPQAELLRQRVEAGTFNAPKHCEVHVGEQDWQSGPEGVKRMAQMLGMACTVVPGAGHQLGKGYVGGVLERWAGH